MFLWFVHSIMQAAWGMQEASAADEVQALQREVSLLQKSLRLQNGASQQRALNNPEFASSPRVGASSRVQELRKLALSRPKTAESQPNEQQKSSATSHVRQILLRRRQSKVFPSQQPQHCKISLSEYVPINLVRRHYECTSLCKSCV